MAKVCATAWFVFWVVVAIGSVGQPKSGTYSAQLPFDIAIMIGVSMYLGHSLAKERK